MSLLMALTEGMFCDKAYNILSLVGTVIIIFKWAIPILLIIIGSFDLGKAVVGEKPEDTKKAYQGLIKRAIAAIIIFFLPAIVGLLIDAVDGREEGNFGRCVEALRLKDF